MKQAVIRTGGKQYVVKEGDILDVELLGDEKQVDLETLAVFDEKDVQLGTPTLAQGAVSAEVVEADFKGDKVQIMKFKAKKRVKTLTGHRQRYSRIKITAIK